MPRFDYTYSVWWNIMLLTIGSVLFSLGIKGIALEHNFIAGGVFGVALLMHYAFGALSPGIIYFLLNIPLFVLGWVFVSKRFLLYSLYAMVFTSVFYELVDISIHIENQVYAAVACGVVTGAGGGIILRSLGSAGGLDIMAVILFQRYNIGVGKFYFLFNAGLFFLAALQLSNDLLIASLIMVFISSVVVEYVLALFSKRKIVFVISDHSQELAKAIMTHLRLGATFIKGRGAYSGTDKEILMTVINNIQLKRLEELVFTHDPKALFIVENTFNVLGSSFSRRKIY
jgi:uncharacterized membrane-anchored protein YitT (DUF2179 family)